MPNIGKNPSAKSIGVLMRIEPPHSDRNKQVKIITDGTEIIIVVAWKKVAIFWPMPVIYMWCAHTMNDRKPTNRAEYTSDL